MRVHMEDLMKLHLIKMIPSKLKSLVSQVKN